ncbi:MAG: hypothetical protein ACPGOV_11740 [Magnetovibrionaceae bacterium]
MSAAARQRAALTNLALAAAPFAHGQGMGPVRKQLQTALAAASVALNEASEAGIPSDMEGLKKALEKVEAEEKDQPGFRKDLSG